MTVRTAWRKMVNVLMFSLAGGGALLTVSILLFILGYLVWHGARDFNWAFLTRLPQPVGETGGGIVNSIVGSAKLVLLATAIAAPVGILAGVYLAEFGGRAGTHVVRYAADLLNGVPSIVVGLFAYIVVVLPMKGFSTLAGGIALSVILVPAVLRTTEELLRTVPRSMREGAMALGASRWRAIASVVLPAAAPGIMTGVLLGIARVAGETAPLLFTAFDSPFWSHGWGHPTASLPVTIYTHAISPYNDWHRQAWAAGAILLMLVLAVNVGARLLLWRRAAYARGR